MELMTEEKKGFKRTDVGLIPKDWEVKLLDDLIIDMTDYVASGSFASLRENVSVYESHNHAIYVRLFDLRLGLGHNKQKFVDKESYQFLSKSNLYGNEILMANIGANVGETFIMPVPEQPATIAPNMIVIRPDEELLLPQYLLFFSKSKKGKNKLHELASGSGHPKINKTDLKKLPCVVPPVSEQQAIAEALSDLDELIRSLDGLIQKKQAIKKGTMQQLLTGKKRLSGFDGEWEVKKLGDVADCFAGGTPSTSNRSYYGGEINFITSSDLNSNRIKTVENKITKDGLLNSSAKEVNSKTLLLALYGATAGIAAITEIDGAINQAVLAILPISAVREFLFYNLRLHREDIIEKYTQGGQPNLSGKIVKSIEMSIPPIEEQKAIARILSDMDQELQTLRQKREKYVQIKQGMMQELLTGRVRLV